MSETPRTDAARKFDADGNAGLLIAKLTNCAAQLECELTAANLALKEVREKVKEECAVLCDARAEAYTAAEFTYLKRDNFMQAGREKVAAAASTLCAAAIRSLP